MKKLIFLSFFGIAQFSFSETVFVKYGWQIFRNAGDGRSLALGKALTAGGVGTHASLWNPANLVANTKKSFTYVYQSRFSGVINSDLISFPIHKFTSKPFGFMPFYPGPGVGGHCIPVDPFYLAWKAREYDFYVNFIELAAETNDNMPYHTLSLITESLSKARKPLNGSQILVLGVTFKENINDSRNSPAIRVMELLIEQGAMVSYQDDYVPTLNVCDLDLESLDLSQCVFANYDAVIILSGHNYFDWSAIVDSSDLVIDTRNVTNMLGQRPNVVKL